MPIPARQLYFEAIKVGDELPPLVKPPIERIQLVRYAGASGDFNPIHVDEQHARNAGFPGVFAPGMLTMAFTAQLGSEWLRGARLVKFTTRFVKIVWPGDVITCRGRVVDRRFEAGGGYFADIEVWAENQRGELCTKGVVTAQLFYNAEDEARQRAGAGPLVVTKEEEEARLMRLAPRGRGPGRPLSVPTIGGLRPLARPLGAPLAPRAIPTPAAKPQKASKPAPKKKVAARTARPPKKQRPRPKAKPPRRPKPRPRPKAKPRPKSKPKGKKKR